MALGYGSVGSHQIGDFLLTDGDIGCVLDLAKLDSEPTLCIPRSDEVLFMFSLEFDFFIPRPSFGSATSSAGFFFFFGDRGKRES